MEINEDEFLLFIEDFKKNNPSFERPLIFWLLIFNGSQITNISEISGAFKNSVPSNIYPEAIEFEIRDSSGSLCILTIQFDFFRQKAILKGVR